MGGNKLLMNIGGELIIERVIREIKSSNVSKIILVGRDEKVIDIALKEKIEVVKNNDAIRGQSESIRLGIEKSILEYDFMFFCGDQPFIDSESINNLIDTSIRNKDKIIIPRVKNFVGSPVIFPNSFKEELELLTGDVGGREVIKKNNEKLLYVDVKNQLFLQDIDTNDDYMKYIAHKKPTK